MSRMKASVLPIFRIASIAFLTITMSQSAQAGRAFLSDGKYNSKECRQVANFLSLVAAKAGVLATAACLMVEETPVPPAPPVASENPAPAPVSDPVPPAPVPDPVEQAQNQTGQPVTPDHPVDVPAPVPAPESHKKVDCENKNPVYQINLEYLSKGERSFMHFYPTQCVDASGGAYVKEAKLLLKEMGFDIADLKVEASLGGRVDCNEGEFNYISFRWGRAWGFFGER